jgi:short-subunit dehydrogenase
MKRIAVFGAASAMAQATARLLAGRGGAAFFLVGRGEAHLKAVADDLRARGAASVAMARADLDDTGGHGALVDQAFQTLSGLDLALIAYGRLDDQRACELSAAAAEAALRTNFISPAVLAGELANRMESQGKGCIAVLSSVAGDRGRPSNYVYGAAKGGLSLFLQGLRGRMHKRGVRILTIKPGPIDTPMTAHMKKGLMFSTPERAAKAIVRALNSGRDVAYVPGFWRAIMWVLTSLPESLFKRLPL